MMWDILTQDEKNHILLKLLVHVCKADDVLHENEFAYLLHVCKILKVNPEVIREYMMQDEKINEILPQSEQERMNILYHLLFIMKSDKNIHPIEEIKIYQLSFRLGFSEEMTREFIQLYKENNIDQILQDSMLNIIRKHNN